MKFACPESQKRVSWKWGNMVRASAGGSVSRSVGFAAGAVVASGVCAFWVAAVAEDGELLSCALATGAELQRASRHNAVSRGGPVNFGGHFSE